MKKTVAAILALALTLLIPGVGPAGAEDAALKPYVLAEQVEAPFTGKVDAVRQSLTGTGFEIVGEYAFGDDAVIIVVTDNELRSAAAQTDLGGFGAAQRVSVTRVGKSLQVAYTNPRWMAAIYRMGADLAAVAGRLEQALGRLEQFGTKKGLSAGKLGKYHYMAFMPYFTDGELLADHGSYAAAVEKVEQGLAASSGAAKVYRVDIPGKEQSLFGVAVLEGKGADETVMENCDKTTLRHTAHLPYEVLVSGGKVLMLHGKFRIAQSFPDLTMGTFMKISGAPKGIKKALRAAVQ